MRSDNDKYNIALFCVQSEKKKKKKPKDETRHFNGYCLML